MGVFVIVRPCPYVPRGQLFVMVNYEHPETPLTDFSWGEKGLEAVRAEIPDGRILLCHPDDEQMARDKLARAQEMT
jgi:hypothetical protein